MGISSFGIKIPVDSRGYGKEMGLSLMVSYAPYGVIKLIGSHGTTSNFTNSSCIGYR